MKTHLSGVLVHREGHQGGNKAGYAYIDFMQYCHDANLNLSIFLDVLLDFKDELGETLHIQMDSASNNNKETTIAICGLLVHKEVYNEVYLHMLPVGHTHKVLLLVTN
jgi:hypothetical protein